MALANLVVERIVPRDKALVPGVETQFDVTVANHGTQDVGDLEVTFTAGDSLPITKVIDIPAEPADPDDLPAMLKGFKACPPLVTDIDLSVDDKLLYVSCWGTGDFHQYDVSDPFNPKLVSKVRIGGIVSRASHPASSGPLNGGPQMVEVSRDGRRVYFTNSLYGAIDRQFYEGGLDGWMVKLNVDPNGGMELDPEFFLSWPAGHLPHQIRLEGGDASSDSYCYP